MTLQPKLKRTIKFFKSNPDLLICKADKGNKIMVMDRDEYDGKMHDLLGAQVLIRDY